MLTQNHDNNFEIFHRNISWVKGTETKVRASRDGLEFVVLVWSLLTVQKYQYCPMCQSTIIFWDGQKTFNSELGEQA